MALHGTFYLLEERPFPFRRCCPAGCLEIFKNKPLPFRDKFHLDSVIKQPGFRFIFQPDFPDIWQESRASAGSQFCNCYWYSTGMRNVSPSVMTTKVGKINMKLSVKEGAEAVPFGFHSTHRTMDKMSL